MAVGAGDRQDAIDPSHGNGIVGRFGGEIGVKALHGCGLKVGCGGRREYLSEFVARMPVASSCASPASQTNNLVWEFLGKATPATPVKSARPIDRHQIVQPFSGEIVDVYLKR